ASCSFSSCLRSGERLFLWMLRASGGPASLASPPSGVRHYGYSRPERRRPPARVRNLALNLGRNLVHCSGPNRAAGAARNRLPPAPCGIFDTDPRRRRPAPHVSPWTGGSAPRRGGRCRPVERAEDEMLGDLLRQYRQRLGLSQEEVAERVTPV